MAHAAEDFKNQNSFLNNLDLTRDFPIPVILSEEEYFIGFCTYQEKIEGQHKFVIPTPKYGMLFKNKPNGSDSLYIGLCNSEGKPQTDLNMKLKGLFFYDLDFSDECLTSHKPHALASNTLNKYKSYYKGGFMNGLFEGNGEVEILNKEDDFVNMPLIQVGKENRQYSKLKLNYVSDDAPGTTFKGGELSGHCNLELTYDALKF